MLYLLRYSKSVAAAAFCAVLAATNTTAPGVGIMATGSLATLLSVAADEADARPRAGAGRPGHGARPPGRHPHVHPRPGAAPRQRHYYREQRRDDWRRVQRRRHALGFLYVTTRPCTTTVVLSDGVTYYFCSNVYYRPYIDNGTTIYVIRE